MACRQKILIFWYFQCMYKQNYLYEPWKYQEMRIFWRQAIKKSIEKIFQGLRMYHIVQNLDGTDRGYQSHQLLTESGV